MTKTSLFADQEREAKLNELGDALRVLEQHVQFKALSAEVDDAAPRPSRERGGRPPFPTELMGIDGPPMRGLFWFQTIIFVSRFATPLKG